MQRLSGPLHDLRSHYDVVVVGSGYGGAIAACRLSRAGRKVAVLERGREIHPGHYPADPVEALRQTQLSAPALGLAEQIGDRRNLYWFRADGHMNVFSGCGLGGTSLVNANVSLRADPRVFDEGWPTALRRGPDGRLEAGLARGYATAEAMLRPTPYPRHFPDLPKIDALRTAAGDRPVGLTPINVTFRSGPNVAGVHQHACTGCGDCVTGCNVAAKNTVLMNYLPDAVEHGAEIFTEVEVRTVHRRKAGPWVLTLRPLTRTANGEPPPTDRVTADIVVLAAGTLGTTEILLRSARPRPTKKGGTKPGLRLSDQLGRHFTGNGDLLGFAHRPGTDVEAVGAGDGPYDQNHPAGPCITAMIDERSPDPAVPVDRAVIIEDAVVPGLLRQVVEATQAARSGAAEPAGFSWKEWWTRGNRARWAGRDRPWSAGHLQTLLLMGHDDDSGHLELVGDEARVVWPDVNASPYYRSADRILAEAADRDGGTYLADPLSSPPVDGLITVHPLGGCVVADDVAHGVADHRGRVFDPSGRGTFHQGLIVADGSVVPRPIGVNPLLTISALAERSMALLCHEQGWTYDTEPLHPAPAGPPLQDPVRPGLRLHDEMAGWWAPYIGPDDDATAPFSAGEAAGKQADDGALSVSLELTSDDVALLTEHLDTPLRAEGQVVAPRLSADPLEVVEGTVRLLVADDPADPAARHMRYRLTMIDRLGHRYALDGFKVVAPGAIGELWPATTTLYTTVRAHDHQGPILGRGVLRLDPREFGRLLATVHVTGPVGHVDRLAYEAKFGVAFAGALARDYGTVVHHAVPFAPDAPPRRHRPLDVPPGRPYRYTTADGKDLRLTRYRGGNASAPVLLSHGAGANPLTFTIDTVQPSLLEYLVAHGYDVWIQEWRASTLLPTSTGQWNADAVANLDHRGAAALIASATGRPDLHVVAHCVGAMTWLMATLAGTVTPTSLLCSSAGAHPVASTLTRVKVGLHLAEILHTLGVTLLTTDSVVGESVAERILDQELRFYPIPWEEECDRAVCRRLAFLYGPAVHHANLDSATHGALHELFGTTNLTMMSHLSLMARREELVHANGQTYLDRVERLDRPITFLHGSENRVWLPVSTQRTYDWLQQELGPANFERTVFPAYGHQDLMIGHTAATDVFPSVLAHLRRVGA